MGLFSSSLYSAAGVMSGLSVAIVVYFAFESIVFVLYSFDGVVVGKVDEDNIKGQICEVFGERLLAGVANLDSI